ncbi:MAG: CDP-alcohol phosphatidyltransferase family protein [Eubacteriales bacterium]
MKKDYDQKSSDPTMLYFVKDLPNIISLAGLLCALIGIYFAITGMFRLAIVMILWAVLFDWADGIAARRMNSRTDNQRAFGPQLDSLIDIVSFGVFPAIFLLSYGQYKPWFLPGAFLIIGTSAIRLSYFNVFGMIDKRTYKGLALDNNVLILSLVFLFEGFFKQPMFAIILYIILVVMLAFNLAPIKTYKFSGRWFYVLIFYVLAMTAVYIFCA